MAFGIRRWLYLIAEAHSKATPIAEEPLERRHVFRGGNYQNVPDSGMHQHGDRVINHRFVKDGQKLLAHSLCNWIKSCA